MCAMLLGLFIRGDNGWVVLANKTISVSLSILSYADGIVLIAESAADLQSMLDCSVLKMNAVVIALCR